MWLVDESTYRVLPFLRVDTITYSAPNTVITLADHADGTTANNNFVSANDCFNGYPLMQLCDTAYHGTIHEVADSVNGTPDQIMISGDVTAQIAATEWLQMLPPSGTACLYLGHIAFDSSGNLEAFTKTGWRYQYSRIPPAINGVKNIYSSPGNTDLGAAIPPTATIIHGYAVVFEPNAAKGVRCYLYSGSSGTNYPLVVGDTDDMVVANRQDRKPINYALTNVALIRNAFEYIANPSVHTAISEGGTAAMFLDGCEE